MPRSSARMNRMLGWAGVAAGLTRGKSEAAAAAVQPARKFRRENLAEAGSAKVAGIVLLIGVTRSRALMCDGPLHIMMRKSLVQVAVFFVAGGVLGWITWAGADPSPQ